MGKKFIPEALELLEKETWVEISTPSESGADVF